MPFRLLSARRDTSSMTSRILPETGGNCEPPHRFSAASFFHFCPDFRPKNRFPCRTSHKIATAFIFSLQLIRGPIYLPAITDYDIVTHLDRPWTTQLRKGLTELTV